MAAGALAAAINAVAGGGTLLTFPVLTIGFQMPTNIANATNAVALWPGSLAGAFGFRNLLDKTRHHLKTLFLPTLGGAAAGSWLFMLTDRKMFDAVIPWLILLAAVLLIFQPKVKAMVMKKERALPVSFGIVLQFLVALYGGYFGAGMGIMMLAAFALYMDGTIHELNAVKNLLGLIINLTASIIFIFKGLVDPGVAGALAVGSVLGGFTSAKLSQKIDPNRLRVAIAVYGIGMAVYYFVR